MSAPTLVVLAAGIGSRYGGLKQIDPIGPSGELIIDYSVYDALQAGFGKVVFVISRRIETEFREQIGKTIEKQCETAYVHQEVTDVPPGFRPPAERRKPWGTAHAVFVCRYAVDTNLVVINADDFYGPNTYQMLAEHLSHIRQQAPVPEFCMAGYPLLNTLTEHGEVARGVCLLDEDGFLVEIHERTRVRQFGQMARYTEDGESWADIPPERVASMNVWGFTPAIFAELEGRFARFLRENTADLDKVEFYLSEVVGALVRERRARVRVLPATDRWFGMTYHEDKPRVKRAIRDLIGQGVYPETLWGEAR
jgi:choline kinase